MAEKKKPDKAPRRRKKPQKKSAAFEMIETNKLVTKIAIDVVLQSDPDDLIVLDENAKKSYIHFREAVKRLLTQDMTIETDENFPCMDLILITLEQIDYKEMLKAVLERSKK